jgi:hypothetical protein
MIRLINSKIVCSSLHARQSTKLRYDFIFISLKKTLVILVYFDKNIIIIIIIIEINYIIIIT